MRYYYAMATNIRKVKLGLCKSGVLRTTLFAVPADPLTLTQLAYMPSVVDRGNRVESEGAEFAEPIRLMRFITPH